MKIRANDGIVRATQAMRCRQCKNCREAKRRYWGNLGAQETLTSAKSGNRTWFGTLTFDTQSMKEMLHRSIEKNAVGENSSAVPAWFDNDDCDERFALMRDEITAELKKYWKRLRKAGHQFSYLVTIERHNKNGDVFPHVHFLLHEKGERILKKNLAAKWSHGFVKIKLAGGSKVRMDEAMKCSWYVVKYITKHSQSRILASINYGKKDPLEVIERSE